jgi:membrane protein YqaA with SNARE-associated domain
MFNPWLLFAVVFVTNVIPVLMPPTWAVLSLFNLTYGGSIAELVILGAVASTLGGYALAKLSGPIIDSFLPRRQKRNIKYLKRFLSGEGWKVTSIISFPSNMMFIVVGATEISMLPVLVGFFVGRLISYAILITVVAGAISVHHLFSPANIIIGIVGVAAAVVLLFLDWKSLIHGAVEHERKKRAEAGVRHVFKE